MKNPNFPPPSESNDVHEAQAAFIARGLAARQEAKRINRYVSSAEMLERLDSSLTEARAKQEDRSR